MNKTGIVIILLCFLAAAAVVLWERRKARKTMEEIERMLDAAMTGSFSETNFDESQLSALETKFAHYLSAAEASYRNVAQEKDKIKTLIADISHQTKTPIANLLLYSELLMEETLPASAKANVEALYKQSEKLRFLIDSLVKLSRLENGIISLSPQQAALQPLLESVVEQYAAKASEKGLSLQLQDTNAFAVFDFKWTAEALANIVDNAIKYTEQGRVTLSLYQTMRNEVAYTEIKVSDTGYGISAEALPHIFDRYYQEGSEHQASGTGIGLALVKNLVVLHEGEIRVESSLNVGSTFYVSLLTDNTYPHVLHADSTEKTSDEKDEKEENIEPVHSGKRILLIVEDNRDICDYIVESFSDDFEVRTAANGEQGLEQALGCIPDIIVSDIMMPVMNGIVMCRKLKEDLRTSHIPIILLTAKDSLQDKEEGYQVGADSYLTKPFSATLLHSRIHNLLESRKLLAERFNTNSILIDKRAAVTESMNKLDNEFLEKINKLIEDRLSSEKIDIGYLSDAMCMSNSTLYRKMKALTGLSTNEYIRKIKMQYAERLLLEGKYNISEVAFKVGINSTVYFRQCFKDEFGMAPSDYLKKIKPE